ncbi:Butirosin biosynthesis [Melia azedarach]|uniref:Butirosin biosynthesis n=1 Tax=Melia azedarach TaxID=155640 RepID=A0ACC1YGH5_MELAZ|nr:Butirosin biosynthesis [Melia azedarach]
MSFNIPAAKPEAIQLNDEFDFYQLLSPDGLISICGYASLLSERSARTTFPYLINYRVAKLPGFRRVFAAVAPIFFERGIANLETKIPAFIKREHEFRFLAVLPESLDGKPFTNSAVLCARSNDEELFHRKCKGNKDIFFQNYERHNIDSFWPDDILPCRVYLRHCVLAAKNLGDEAYNNFLDHTFLGDRKTTIREYLAMTGAGIMEEEPPESLKTRYGG